MGSTDATTQYSTSATFHAFWADAGLRPQIAAMSKGINCPTQIARPTSGTKITVAQLTLSFVYIRSRPIMRGNASYKGAEVAIPPPEILARAVPAAPASA